MALRTAECCCLGGFDAGHHRRSRSKSFGGVGVKFSLFERRAVECRPRLRHLIRLCPGTQNGNPGWAIVASNFGMG